MNPKNKWNSKYKERINQLEAPMPNERLAILSPYLTGGSALDLACGLGGNSLFLARLNFQVQAIDISDVAVNYLEEIAGKQKLAIFPRLCDLTDMAHLNLNNSSFSLIVITYYLDRSLFPLIKSIVKDNGYFFMETFYKSPKKESQGVSDQYKLLPGELLAEFSDWKVLFYEENEHEGRQTIFCQKQKSV
ncbi:methyltransferase domain-containing protein [Priestia megaterium]|uniref:Methyltransferase domain-containing protein n=1 Tax=Priestia megaterium TaxID=1404 RepID=A0A6H1P781_PRIMG|nr:methyltransferase domain-containing protein [Priestia megaterium]QIZ09292.1 methyltransferase domain-containing protein [Priestia megaterium]